MGVSLSGLFSGLDTNAIINQIVAVSRIPIQRLQAEQSSLTNQETAYGFIRSSLDTLRTKLTALNDSTAFKTKSVSSSTAATGAATVDSTASAGTVALNITQLATSSILRGGNASGLFSDTKTTTPPAGSALAKTVLNADLSANNVFSINGVQIALDNDDVLDDGSPSSTNSVIGKINNSTAGITAAYNSTTGKFSLTSASTIILGSGGDTSDFLQQAQLFNNGTSGVASSVGIGRLNETSALTSAGLRTAPTTGAFTINGVSITYASGESLQTVLANINSSAAGVIATYDRYSDRVALTAKGRGAQGISAANGTSNLATALRLASSDSELTVGKPALFTVGDDPATRRSEDENLTAAEIGVTGLAFKALQTGSTTLTISPDTAGIKTSIDAFLTQYNSAQALIESYIKIDTSDPSKNGLLVGDSTLTFLPQSLRSATTRPTASNASVRMLEDLGIVGNSGDNSLTLADSAKLTSALENHLDEVIGLFTNSSDGLAARLDPIITAYQNSVSGIIVTRTNAIDSRQSGIDREVDLLERRVADEQVFLESQFAILEQFQGQSQNFSNFFKLQS